ncbi:ATP-binding protein [Micromonospora sp. DT81.3]|uniref:ATP-binding protein n=1 Tax=Micromonospora sp. DT81.3 TaxID=3416523 RepID=UPI003CEEC143
MTGGPYPAIRTPDQRIRVFISSTLRELADERLAVRAAVERMGLAPVMFELGARPHPPRELYRSYLAQSDVFIGIYADSYGWVAPGEEISGLEDEYRLAPASMPKLIYIKASDGRDPRLAELIDRIRSDDTAAYLPFRNAEDLERQVAADLATLLAERFDDSRSAGADGVESAASLVARVPSLYTTTIGREAELAQVREMLARGEDRVISLIGPGGIGKSRLAIEAALATEDLFPDGTYFVPLEGVLEGDLLLPTIGFALGIRDNGEAVLEERISRALEGRRVLLVLDNFEQIVDVAPVLVRLYTVAPLARFLVTSRTVLRIRGERVYEVPALPFPAAGEPTSIERARRSAACTLFIDRARAAKPGFELTEENADAVADICRRLEGLPLAIELAAAKVRLLTPQGIAKRLERSLPLLTAAVRDLPERHRTMRATIDWSVSLLPDIQREMLTDLGVFATRFTIDAVEALGIGRSWDGHGIDGLAALVDGSLVKQTDVEGRSVFSLLAIVREYALGRLKERGDADQVRAAHADYYRALVARLAPGLRGVGQLESVGELGLELPNLRAAIRHLVYTDRLDDAADFAWSLLVYWWIAGLFGGVRVWMLELLGKDRPITQHTRAVAWFLALWGEMWQRPSKEVIAGLGETVRLFTDTGDEDAAAMALAARATARVQYSAAGAEKAEKELLRASVKLRALGNGWAEALAEVSLGRLAWVQGRTDEAFAHFDRATTVAVAGNDLFNTSVAGNLRARLKFLGGDVDGAEKEFIQTLMLSIRLHYDEGVAYGLEGLCAVSAARDDARRAGALSVAAARIRHRIGVFDVEAFTVHTPYLARLRERDPEGVAAGERAGEELTVPEAVALALPELDRQHADPLLAHW